MYECFHCRCRSVIWDCDYGADDVGYSDPGIVQMLHCENCGAIIEYFVPLNDTDAIQKGGTDV